MERKGILKVGRVCLLKGEGIQVAGKSTIIIIITAIASVKLKSSEAFLPKIYRKISHTLDKEFCLITYGFLSVITESYKVDNFVQATTK